MDFIKQKNRLFPKGKTLISRRDMYGIGAPAEGTAKGPEYYRNKTKCADKLRTFFTLSSVLVCFLFCPPVLASGGFCLSQTDLLLLSSGSGKKGDTARKREIKRLKKRVREMERGNGLLERAKDRADKATDRLANSLAYAKVRMDTHLAAQKIAFYMEGKERNWEFDNCPSPSRTARPAPAGSSSSPAVSGSPATSPGSSAGGSRLSAPARPAAPRLPRRSGSTNSAVGSGTAGGDRVTGGGARTRTTGSGAGTRTTGSGAGARSTGSGAGTRTTGSGAGARTTGSGAGTRTTGSGAGTRSTGSGANAGTANAPAGSGGATLVSPRPSGGGTSSSSRPASGAGESPPAERPEPVKNNPIAPPSPPPDEGKPDPIIKVIDDVSPSGESATDRSAGEAPESSDSADKKSEDKPPKKDQGEKPKEESEEENEANPQFWRFFMPESSFLNIQKTGPEDFNASAGFPLSFVRWGKFSKKRLSSVWKSVMASIVLKSAYPTGSLKNPFKTSLRNKSSPKESFEFTDSRAVWREVFSPMVPPAGIFQWFFPTAFADGAECAPWQNPPLSRTYFTSNGRVRVGAFCRKYARKGEETKCRKSLKDLKKALEYAQKADNTLRQLSARLGDLQSEQEDEELERMFEDEEETEARGLCVDCLKEVRGAFAPSGWQRFGGGLSAALGLGLSIVGAREARRSRRSANELLALQGFPAESGGADSLLGAFLGVPLIAGGLNDMFAQTAPEYICSPRFYNNTYMYSPYMY